MSVGSRRWLEVRQRLGELNVVLLHGSDGGLVRSHASELIVATAGSIDDPFRVVLASPDSASGVIVNSLLSRPMTGGRMVVWARDGGDWMIPYLIQLPDRFDGLLVIEAGELGGRSRLLSRIESAPRSVVMACHVTGSVAGRGDVAALLLEKGLRAEGDIVAWLAEYGASDREGRSRMVDVLALYSNSNEITLDDVHNCLGDESSRIAEDVYRSAAAGLIRDTDSRLTAVMATGASAISVIRVAVARLLRDARIIRSHSGGIDSASAARRLFQAERECKQTGRPEDTVVRDALLTLANRGSGGDDL